METNKQKAKKAGFPFLIMIGGIGFSVLFIILFANLAEELLEKEVEIFDATIINWFKYIENGTLDQIMIFGTELGSVWFLSVCTVAAIIGLWFTSRDKWGILFLVIGIGGGGLLTTLLKHLYARDRPSINPEIDAIGYSFPSGHSMGSLIFYGFIAYFIVRSSRKKVLKWFVILTAGLVVIWIGSTRIYLGAHYPSDVLAGHLAGAIWLILTILALEWVEWRSANSIRPTHVFKRFVGKYINF
ncbi:phosphatase PAP2 family protein [Metabacillus litoralis]|uniref:Phosphatase PAP2 family protein n=1 Tax=Metabacillus litoralis TaxID=152268 RepID=A0A5C6WA04_9BACI|nr:phosphatase PAP2 family protein [Metabacillus litoralis]TXC92699.1 phosphatase PAP2 family protein [Metabacillus litoralis]